MYNQLTREQGYAIYPGIQEGRSQRAIARQINVSPSTVSREIGRNASKLIRQYMPKGADFDLLTDEFIHSVQLKINRRHREKLNFPTPKDEFFRFLS